MQPFFILRINFTVKKHNTEITLNFKTVIDSTKFFFKLFLCSINSTQQNTDFKGSKAFQVEIYYYYYYYWAAVQANLLPIGKVHLHIA